MAKALVLSGDGINCERETARAFEVVGFQTQIVHINELIKNSSTYKNVQAFALPGGFSFGDELGSGKLLALKLQYELSDYLRHLIDSETLIIGICNGFQALVSLGILPGNENQAKLASLAYNLNSNNERIPFLNKWVELSPKSTHCIWTKDLTNIQLPVRHGEGRLIFKDDQSVYERLNQNGQIPLAYTEDLNGSFEKSAALCDETGKVFGLMPHPEAAMSAGLNPLDRNNSDELGPGYKIFKNAYNYFQ